MYKMKYPEYAFSPKIKIIGINPYVSVPPKVLRSLFNDAGKDKGPIPIKGNVNGKSYLQTLMKYAGEWRLYINTTMLPRSPERVGEKIDIVISFDPTERKIEMHPMLKKALAQNKAAKAIFEKLSPSRRKEIVRYISNLKSEEKIKANVEKAIKYLLGTGGFVGREKL